MRQGGLMISENDCTDWNDFKKFLAEELYCGEPLCRGRFLFRGHGNVAWALSSSFDRAFGHLALDARNSLATELLTAFKKQCQIDNELQEVLRDDVATLAFGRHHGLPTRLLDWSESPYVAAFFAFADHFEGEIAGREVSGEVAVWYLDATSEIWSPEYGVELVSPARWRDVRLLRQCGWFTLSRTPFRNLEDYHEEFRENGDGALGRISLPTSAAVEAMSDLDLMGINPASLFSSAEGMARTAVYQTLMKLKGNE